MRLIIGGAARNPRITAERNCGGRRRHRRRTSPRDCDGLIPGGRSAIRKYRFRVRRDPGTIPRGTAAKDRIALGHYYCFVDVLPVVLSKKLPTASANCCGTVSMALCC